MKETIYEEKKQLLMELLQKRKFGGNKLPTEEQLTDILNTSKGTVREILRELEQMGYVSKKHGLGNFMHPSAFETRMRLEIFLDFQALIADGGYTPSIKPIPTDPTDMSKMPLSLLERLGLSSPDEALFVQRLYFANEKPAILSKIVIPKGIVDAEIDASQVVGDLYGFIQKNCGLELEQSILHIVPHKATVDDIELLNAKDASVLFFWEQTFYSFYDEVVCVAENSFNLEVLPITMLRK